MGMQGALDYNDMHSLSLGSVYALDLASPGALHSCGALKKLSSFEANEPIDTLRKFVAIESCAALN